MRLLVTSALGGDETRLAELRALGHDVLFLQDERGPLPEGARDVDGVVCNALFLHHDVAEFPNLRFVQLTSAGLDRAPVDAFAARGVALFNARGVYSIPLAEWLVMQLLQVTKRARFFLRNQDERRWQKARDLTELAGRTACIVGFGDVGREVAKRLRAFDVRIVAVDAAPIDSPLADEATGVDAVGRALAAADFVVLTVPLTPDTRHLIDDAAPTVMKPDAVPVNVSRVGVIDEDALGSALAAADFVVLTVPLTPDTRHLIDDAALTLMKPDAVLVNVSRGGVIDEVALVRALESGRFAGVALDVFEHEPLDPASPLWGFERVLITPHNSFVSDRTPERLFRLVLTNLASVDTAAGAATAGGH